MRYETLTDAARHLGIAQSALVVQINRLERDIGGSPLDRAERGRPMALTTLGEQVLDALDRVGKTTVPNRGDLRSRGKPGSMPCP